MSELRLNVRENAYHFLEESLRKREESAADTKALKLATILATQGIELLLKARLGAEHPLLVLADLDRLRSRRTVGVEVAIARLSGAGVELDEEDLRRLRRAQRLRNEFMHYEVVATIEQLEAAFADLLEFAHVFHLHEFDGELHDELSDDVWQVEAFVMEQFRRNLVTYQGSEVVNWFPSEILDAQFVTQFIIEGCEWARIPRGAEGDYGHRTDNPCSNCAVVSGQYHALACSKERCPKCGGGALDCGCETEGYLETEEMETAHWFQPRQRMGP